ncbi:MAG: catechol-2,3-dioxygenase, partial [Myxococcota bacterium]
MGGQTTPASVSQLGYLVFEVSDLDAWATFATDILGLGMTRKDDTLTLR